MFSVIDPKGERPKIQGKSHAFSVAEQRKFLASEYETKVWPALVLETVDTDQLP